MDIYIRQEDRYLLFNTNMLLKILINNMKHGFARRLPLRVLGICMCDRYYGHNLKYYEVSNGNWSALYTSTMSPLSAY